MSVTRTIFSVRGYRVSEVYRRISAKSNAVRLCYNRFPPACQGFRNHEDICNTVADIHGIYFFRLAWFTGNTCFLYELFVRFIYADDRTERVIRALIYLQHVLHLRYELGVCFRNAPFLYEPRLDFIFFITSQTVLSVM